MMTRRLWAALLLAMALFVSACGGSEGTGGDGTETGEATGVSDEDPADDGGEGEGGGEQEAAGDQEPITLTIWTFGAMGLDDLIAQYEEEHGGRSHWKGAYVDRPSTPLWPFGHGLTYTTFAVSDLAMSDREVAPDGTVRISAEVANTGDRPGEEVVQLYLGLPARSVTQPVKRLAGFARVPLAPGERRRVTFSVAVPQLSFTNRDMELVVEPGAVEVMVGTSSTDLPLRGDFDIVGGTSVVRGRRPCFTHVEVTEA